MDYLAVHWIHNLPDMPVEIFSELDSERMEVRKVEVFANGTVGCASSGATKGSTNLGIEPLPPAHEIAEQQGFIVRESNADEFEQVWKRAERGVAHR